MLARTEHDTADALVDSERHQSTHVGATEVRTCASGVRIGIAAARSWVVGRVEAVDPGDAVVAASEELQLAIRHLDGVPELRRECSTRLRRDQARGRRECSERHVRRCVGWYGLGVNRDVESATLKLSRRSQPDGAAANHRGSASRVLERELRSEQATPPAHGMARAAVPVVVDDRLVIQLLGTDVEARRAVRSQANRRSNDPIPGSDDRWKRKA